MSIFCDPLPIFRFLAFFLKISFKIEIEIADFLSPVAVFSTFWFFFFDYLLKLWSKKPIHVDKPFVIYLTELTAYWGDHKCFITLTRFLENLFVLSRLEHRDYLWRGIPELPNIFEGRYMWFWAAIFKESLFFITFARMLTHFLENLCVLPPL